MSILSVDSISRKYGEKWGLKPLTAAIGDGDFVTVFGPNGAGKSTLLKVLSQQSRPTSGTVLYRGEPLKELGNAYRSKIGVISHQPFLYEGLSALENLTFYARLYGVKDPEARARELLKRVEMNRRMHDNVRTFSRGMLQRTSIARALINSPEIIFLDEPYTGLDKQASYMLTDILKEQVEHKSTIILITHDLPLGYELADKVMILCGGECRYFGDKSAVRTECEVRRVSFESYYLDVVAEPLISVTENS